MKTVKRIAALLIVIILVILCITTLILAFIDTPTARTLFRGCMFATITLPICIYAMMLAYKYLSGKKKD